MIKWFVYIVFLLVSTPHLLSAKADGISQRYFIELSNDITFKAPAINVITDTIKTVKAASKTQDSKVKEVAKAKRQPKPEKVDENGGQGDAQKVKPKRQRRPDGMERPPEIPRRNDN